MHDGDIVGLIDIGSYNITILVVRMFYANQKIELLAMEHKGVSALISQDGNIEEGALLEIIYNIEEKQGLHVDNIAMSVGNNYLKFKNIQRGFKFEYPIAINQSHITKIEKSCSDRKNMLNNDIIVDLFNNYYALDDKINVTDPINLQASSIVADYLLVYANSSIINNLNRYVAKNKLEIISFVSSSQAACLATIKPEHRIGSTAVISIGNCDTSVAIIENGYLKNVNHLAIGGLKITNDIIKIFGLSRKDAENIKILASNIGTNDDCVLSKDNFSSLSSQQIIRLSDVYQVIHKNIKEIFIEISHLANAQNIILTGGVSKMSNIEEIAQLILKKHCQIGIAKNQDWIIHNNQNWQINILKSTNYTTVIGIGGYLLKKYKQKHLSEHNNFFLNKLYKISSFFEELFY